MRRMDRSKPLRNLLSDPLLPAQLRGAEPGLTLLQDRDDLFLAMSFAFH